MRPLPLLLAALAGVALLGVPARGQVGSSTISGMVLYAGGEPATARIYYARLGQYRQTTSRFRAGRNVGYTIPNLIAGRYEMIVSAPGAKPKRIWGVQVGSFDQLTRNITLQRGTPEEELVYQEEGVPIREDLPHDWAGGWISGMMLSPTGAAVEGNVSFWRASTRYLTIPSGSPTLPAYYESRALQPGTWDILFEPSPSAKLKPVRIEKLVVDAESRTVLGPVRVPAGVETDAPVTLPLPERSAARVPLVAPRRRAP